MPWPGVVLPDDLAPREAHAHAAAESSGSVVHHWRLRSSVRKIDGQARGDEASRRRRSPATFASTAPSSARRVPLEPCQRAFRRRVGAGVVLLVERFGVICPLRCSPLQGAAVTLGPRRRRGRGGGARGAPAAAGARPRAARASAPSGEAAARCRVTAHAGADASASGACACAAAGALQGARGDTPPHALSADSPRRSRRVAPRRATPASSSSSSSSGRRARPPRPRQRRRRRRQRLAAGLVGRAGTARSDRRACARRRAMSSEISTQSVAVEVVRLEDLVVDLGRVVDDDHDLGLRVEVGPRAEHQLVEGKRRAFFMAPFIPDRPAVVVTRDRARRACA